MPWSELMDKIYQFLGTVAARVLAVLAWFEALFARLLAALMVELGRLGVAEEQRLLVAYACLYGLATLLVLLLVWGRLRQRRTRAESAPPPAEVSPTPAAAPVVTRDAAAAATVPQPEVEAVSLFERMRAGLSKTQSALLGKVDQLFGSGSAVDARFLEELEEILITADFGMKTTRLLLDSFKRRVANEKVQGLLPLRTIFKEEIKRLLTRDVSVLDCDAKGDESGPFVMMVIGVNGVGKTTTVGKLAQQFSRQGKKVILGAADTFRAAAADQLMIWGERTGVTVIRHDEGSDPAAVAFDAVKAAVARKADILLLDTAGRLHTKVNLMEEMKKIYRVLGREIPGAPHETLLVLDATTGQNALVQARLFQESVGVTGIVLTKLDGSAKGGMAVAIGAELGLPVRYVGIGEGVDDLRAFDPEMFVDALFENH